MLEILLADRTPRAIHVASLTRFVSISCLRFFSLIGQPIILITLPFDCFNLMLEILLADRPLCQRFLLLVPSGFNLMLEILLADRPLCQRFLLLVPSGFNLMLEILLADRGDNTESEVSTGIEFQSHA